MDRHRLLGRLSRAAVEGALLVISLAGCSGPSIRGYQVQGVPEGFLFSANVDGGLSDFPNLEILSQGVWLGDIRTFEPQSQIHVTRYAGNATFEEAQTARDAQATRYGNPSSIDYGQVATLTIDGRTAFGWLETRYDENGAVRSLDYKAVIPYDTVTYAVEFDTSAPDRLHPDSLTRVVHSWGQGETVVHWRAIVTGVVVVAALGLFLIGRANRPLQTVYASSRRE